MKYHRISRVLPQLSYSHIQPMGWKDIRVPSSAPISETRLLNTGIALAMIYAVITTPNVQRSQVVQCRRVLVERCLVLRRRRTKIYLLGTCRRKMSVFPGYTAFGSEESYMRKDHIRGQNPGDTNPIGNLLHKRTRRP